MTLSLEDTLRTHLRCSPEQAGEAADLIREALARGSEAKAARRGEAARKRDARARDHDARALIHAATILERRRDQGDPAGERAEMRALLIDRLRAEAAAPRRKVRSRANPVVTVLWIALLVVWEAHRGPPPLTTDGPLLRFVDAVHRLCGLPSAKGETLRDAVRRHRAFAPIADSLRHLRAIYRHP